MLRLACLFAFLAPAAFAQPQVVLFPGQQGDALRAALVDAYRPASVLSEGAGKDRMYDTVWNTTVGGTEGVVGVYTGFFVPFDCQPSCDPSQDVFNQGSENTQGINQEHIWPRAEGVDGTQAERDLHHLAPTFVRANSDRGNLPFGESADAQTDDWYISNTVTSTIPGVDIDAYSERNRNVVWEPREDFKGDAARAMFYIATIYGDVVDMYFFMGQREALRAWHEADPVDQAEYDRTFVIAGFQSDTPNPFVLDSTLIRRAFFSGQPVASEAGLPADGVHLSPAHPNPFADRASLRLRLAEAQRVRVELFDVLGRRVRLLHDGYAAPGAPIDVRIEAAGLPAGLYVVRASGDTFRATRRVTLAR